MIYDLLLKNCRIPRGNQTVLADILVKDGVIRSVGLADGEMPEAREVPEAGNMPEAREVLDIHGMLVLPGCIDSHTHYMDPGFTHRETFASGTKSAAAGGVTTVIDMPCCSVPSVRDIPSMEHKLAAIAPQAYVDFALWGGVTGEDVREGKLENVKAQAQAGVVAFKAYMTPSVPTYPRARDSELLEIFRCVSKTGLPLGVHCENFDICDFNVNKLRQQGRLDGPAWAEARASVAEKAAIQLCIDYAQETGARFHVVHMSTGEGAVLVEEAKKKGLTVTAETCPHYLVLNAEESMTRFGAFAKIAPPLRTEQDNEILWEKLRDGAVDFIATDHAPYEIATEKDAPGMDIWTSFPGIPGTETMVPILISEGLNKGRIGLERLVEVLSKAPAVHYGLYPKKGCIEPGSDADFTIVDLEEKWTVRAGQMWTKSKYTPFDGMELTGKIKRTIVRGRTVYADGVIQGEAGCGRFIRRQEKTVLERRICY